MNRGKKGQGRKTNSRPDSAKKPRFSKPRKNTKPQAPAAPKPAGEGSDLIRLNKYLATAGIASRREADNLIKAGTVEVNGKVVTEMGYKVRPGDEVSFNGEMLREEKKVYLVLNKPKGFITTMDDPHARKTVMELIANAGPERLYPVGRLDRKTTGVLLFTNDGDMAATLMHPSSGARKIYQVTLDNKLTNADFSKIQSGLTLEDGPIQVDEISFIEGKGHHNVGVTLHSGRNRIVRRIFEHLGYEVVKLDRVYFAGLTKKTLNRGQWRKLSPKEVNFLRMK
ncbi:pseudouridine synthase [Owenweeksia hongkongensis]|uniref:pseudouridine synthase n=1 Tax=Owenweeksia hongkongensis TaxID=253245 RepID=UPI003A8FB10A